MRMQVPLYEAQDLKSPNGGEVIDRASIGYTDLETAKDIARMRMRGYWQLKPPGPVVAVRVFDLNNHQVVFTWSYLDEQNEYQDRQTKPYRIYRVEAANPDIDPEMRHETKERFSPDQLEEARAKAKELLAHEVTRDAKTLLIAVEVRDERKLQYDEAEYRYTRSDFHHKK